MKFLENKIPPIVIVAICAALMWLLSAFATAITLDQSWSRCLAGSFFLLGSGIMLAAAYQFYRHKTTLNPSQPQRAQALVASGIYSLSRNPIYLGYGLWLLAVASWLQTPLVAACALIYGWYITVFQILPEERALSEIFGESFSKYKTKAHRWL